MKTKTQSKELLTLDDPLLSPFDFVGIVKPRETQQLGSLFESRPFAGLSAIISWRTERERERESVKAAVTVRSNADEPINEYHRFLVYKRNVCI